MVVEREVEEEEKGKRSCILVGLQIDGDGKELLGWVIKNLAEEGQRVVSVNVSRNQDPSRNPTPSLIKVLDECSAEHQDLCTMKKIVLVGRISKGKSVKKVLVKEAEICAAKSLVVGVNKNCSFGGSASLAGYCDRKLPSTIDLIAVHRGKIIFRRTVTKAKTHPVGHDKPNLRNDSHPGVFMNSEFIPPSSETKPEPLNYCLIDYGMMRERNKSSISALVKELQESKPGWPLLRKEATANLEAQKESEARKMSVVHWVMKLPDRSMAAGSTQGELVKELETILENNSSSCRFFQCEELQNSTNYFSPEHLIGRGGNSQVYMGFLPEDKKVAVKVSKLSEESSRDFVLEVEIMTGVQHDRIVPLIGICVEDQTLYSVYSYFSRGSLEENLHGKTLKAPLSWEMRFKVAVGVAEALTYLHENCSRPVIHRDVKSSNILLSDEFKPQLSDFGLAIWAPSNAQYLTHGDVVGTFGYLAPEYFMYGKVSTRVDVYAFGVVLLELLTGRKPINDENPKGQESLVMWAKPILDRGDIMGILDPNLNGKYDEEQMQRMVLAASLCIRREARRRPQIRQVHDMLQGKEEARTSKSVQADEDVTAQDGQDEDACPAQSVGSHLGLALLDVEDDDASVISFEQNNLHSLDEYIHGRWSRSSSFD